MLRKTCLAYAMQPHPAFYRPTYPVSESPGVSIKGSQSSSAAKLQLLEREHDSVHVG
jgi:hypothetical protein